MIVDVIPSFCVKIDGSVVVLLRELDTTACSGFAVMLLLLPLTARITAGQVVGARQQSELRAQRMRLVS